MPICTRCSVLFLTLGLALLLPQRAEAITRYVDVNSTAPQPPYTNLANAAVTIQDAVDVAVSNDLVLVSAGVYETGGRAVHGSMTNRVVIDRPVTVRSVNGPDVTVIKGAGPMGDGAVRCAYVGTNAVLDGFTMTNGHTRTAPVFQTELCGGGAWCESNGVVLNCIIVGNAADSAGGGVYSGVVSNCTLVANSAISGGGASDSTLRGCVLSRNSADYNGGGVYGGILYNCTLSGNSCDFRGGGAVVSTLNNCVLWHNNAPMGMNWYEGNLRFCCTTPLPPGTGNSDQDPLLASASHLSAGSPCIGRGNDVHAAGEDIDGESWASPPSIGCDEYRAGAVTGALSVSIGAEYTVSAVGFEVDFDARIDGRTSGSCWEFGDGTVVSNCPHVSHTWSTTGVFAVILRAFNESHHESMAATVTVTIAEQTVAYVDGENTNPVAPYATWDTAANTIQAAVDVTTLPGALVLVTNGVYEVGGRAVFAAMTNRVAVDRPLTLRSVNGPDVTIIKGNGPIGDGAVRCVYLGTNAVLQGFTLTNGCTRAEGDRRWERSAGGVLCENSAVVSNCVIAGSSAAESGGGSYRGRLHGCTLTGNVAEYGGSAAGGVLENCDLSRSSASQYGGGAANASLMGCRLHRNSAVDGGGAISTCIAANCRLHANTATNGGGGAYWSILHSCALARNSASRYSVVGVGGAYLCTLNNCTLTGNSAPTGIGGASRGTLRNCILWDNVGYVPNWSGGTLSYCCTTPLPDGPGNFSQDPRLADAAHLSAGSPCIGRGSGADATGTDIDGEPWANPPAVGCDEYRPGAVTGTLSVAVEPECTLFAADYEAAFSGRIDGRTTNSRWDFGDGTVESNMPHVLHAWSAGGSYDVTFTAFNEDFTTGVSATTRVEVIGTKYVSPLGGHVYPFSSWATAATNIQEALDAEVPGGVPLVLVTNGTYATGGRAVYYADNRIVLGNTTNRVAIDQRVTVRSVNGSDVTIIKGHGPVGDNAVRCVYLGANAVLDGFTLTNGCTRQDDYQQKNRGGGLWCESSGVVSNCVICGNCGSYGGGVYRGRLHDCLLIGNTSNYGGGAYDAILLRCVLRDNTASMNGGGACYGTLNDCVVSNNAARNGGGTHRGTSSNCTIAANRALDNGGGSYQSSLNNCTVSENSALWGGGASMSSLTNCAVLRNSASEGGGGTHRATLNNCTVVGNSAYLSGGGAYRCTLRNCILWNNSARNSSNWYGGTFGYSCTTPLPDGPGNMSRDPLLASASHLGAASPCIGQGNSNYTSGADIDGEPWSEPPSMGCDEYRIGTITGELNVAIAVEASTLRSGIAAGFDGQIEGRTVGSSWDFDDGTVVSNRPEVSYTWAVPGTYAVVLTAFNDDNPGGVSATATVVVMEQPTHYVHSGNSAPSAPYLSWKDAATSIQEAVDAAGPGAIVLVTNGVYATGGRPAINTTTTNRVAVDRRIAVRSVGGPDVTLIRGGGTNGEVAVRCVYLGNGAVLDGFTLTDGVARAVRDSPTDGNGGGVLCENGAIVSNCIVRGNRGHRGGGACYGQLSKCTIVGNYGSDGGGSYHSSLFDCLISGNSGHDGGGVWSGTAQNCIVTGNSAYSLGGGAHRGAFHNCVFTDNSVQDRGGGTYVSTLQNCTVVGNSAGREAGGTYHGTVRNCILRDNAAPTSPNWQSTLVTYSCTTPRPDAPGNIDRDPRFVASNDYRLALDSPCVDAGDSATISAPTDLAGNPRIVGASVDMGAYEYQHPDTDGDLMPDRWEWRHCGDTTNLTPEADADRDGLLNLQEFFAGTSATNPASCLVFEEIRPRVMNGIVVRWQSVGGKRYGLYRATNLLIEPSPLRTNIPASPPMNTETDGTAAGTGPWFYRVRLE